MSRQIPMDRPLSDADRLYLEVRGRTSEIQRLDDMAAAQAAYGEDPEEDDSPDYESKTVAELQEEIDKRNEERGVDDQIPRTGKKDELIRRLQEADASPL